MSGFDDDTEFLGEWPDLGWVDSAARSHLGGSSSRSGVSVDPPTPAGPVNPWFDQPGIHPFEGES